MKGWVADEAAFEASIRIGRVSAIGALGRDQYGPIVWQEVRQGPELPDKFPISAGGGREEEEGGGCQAPYRPEQPITRPGPTPSSPPSHLLTNSPPASPTQLTNSQTLPPQLPNSNPVSSNTLSDLNANHC